MTLMDRKSGVLLRGPQRSTVGFVSTFCALHLPLLAFHTSRSHPYLKATFLNPTSSFEFCNSTQLFNSNHENNSDLGNTRENNNMTLEAQESLSLQASIFLDVIRQLRVVNLGQESLTAPRYWLDGPGIEFRCERDFSHT